MAVTVSPANTKALGIDLLLSTTDRRHELGLEVLGNDGNTYKYARAGAAITQYDALKVDYAESVNDVDPTTATLQVVVGIAPIAAGDNEYFWYICKGSITANVDAGVTAGAQLGSMASAGRLVALDAGAAYAQAEARAILAAAAGVGLQAMANAAANRAVIRIN